jgi:hypothetical protein
MQQEKFTGISSSGNIGEALLDAFGKAEQELKTDLITWKILEISGSMADM